MGKEVNNIVLSLDGSNEAIVQLDGGGKLTIRNLAGTLQLVLTQGPSRYSTLYVRSRTETKLDILPGVCFPDIGEPDKHYRDRAKREQRSHDRVVKKRPGRVAKPRKEIKIKPSLDYPKLPEDRHGTSTLRLVSRLGQYPDTVAGGAKPKPKGPAPRKSKGPSLSFGAPRRGMIGS